MPSATDLLVIGTYFVGFLLAGEAWRAVRSPRTRVILRGLRLAHFRAAAPILPAVLTAAVALAVLVPATQWGWVTALGGQGSLLLGQVQIGAESDQMPLGLRLAPWILPLLVVFCLPAAARWEEQKFRRGSERRSPLRRLAWALAFGLAHMLLGVPLAAALALSLAGSAFERAYLRGYAGSASRHEALMASTRVHLAYNGLLLTLLAAGAMALLRA